MNHHTNLEIVNEAWFCATKEAPPEMIDLEVRLSALTTRLLAIGEPVSAEQLAHSWGFSIGEVEKILEGAKGKTVQLDESGRLIGAAGLSLLPSGHTLRVNGKTLYAWCAFDAILLPGFLGQTAEVFSKDPVSGESIRLIVGPQGIESYAPKEVVLSIAVPGVSYADTSLRTGPGSAVCSQMHFFSSAGSAETWIRRYPGAVTLTVREAFQVAHTLWLARLPEELRHSN